MVANTLRSTPSPVSSVLHLDTSATTKVALSQVSSLLVHSVLRIRTDFYSTEYVRRKPYCIVLIDEIEKAAREFVTLFLQVLDDGRLTDGQGRVVDFRNTVIVMTSNLGAAYLNDMGEGPVKKETRELVMGAIQVHFPPEFINRIDDIIIFVSLLLAQLTILWYSVLTLGPYSAHSREET